MMGLLNACDGRCQHRAGSNRGRLLGCWHDGETKAMLQMGIGK